MITARQTPMSCVSGGASEYNYVYASSHKNIQEFMFDLLLYPSHRFHKYHFIKTNLFTMFRHKKHLSILRHLILNTTRPLLSYTVLNHMPTSEELAKHPYVRVSWDHDDGGSSDDLGNGKFYIHTITGAPRAYT